ncbi:MAG: hypothetical protein H7A51_01680 [Akkermansiaceae bacterium]|nr:hypothetical protein [Akkermansiaceae bacterium]
MMIDRMKAVFFFLAWQLASALNVSAADYLLLYKVNHTDRDAEVRSVLCKKIERRDTHIHALSESGRMMVVASAKWHRVLLIPDYRFPEITSQREVELFNQRLELLQGYARTYPSSAPYLKAAIAVMEPIDSKLKQGLVVHGGVWMAKDEYLARMETERKQKAAAMAAAEKHRQQTIKEEEERARMIAEQERRLAAARMEKERREYEAQAAAEHARRLAGIEREKKERIKQLQDEIQELDSALEQASADKQRRMEELQALLRK